MLPIVLKVRIDDGLEACRKFSGINCPARQRLSLHVVDCGTLRQPGTITVINCQKRMSG